MGMQAEIAEDQTRKAIAKMLRERALTEREIMEEIKNANQKSYLMRHLQHAYAMILLRELADKIENG